MIIESSAPTRVDLAGGTIDIWPLYLFHPGATTVNFAISLHAHCRIETRSDDRIILESRDRGVSFETIVVDNGSTDGSADAAEREFGAHVIRNQQNRGFCAANNQGIAAAKGEFIALLNNDAEAEPDWLAELSRAYDELGADGVGLHTHYDEVYLGDARLEPVMAALDDAISAHELVPAAAVPSRRKTAS